jgi:hypothetical protein
MTLFHYTVAKTLPDYLMLNTDRGADNYMIKYCESEHEKLLAGVSTKREMPLMTELRRSEPSATTPMSVTALPPVPSSSSRAYSGDYTKRPHIHIAAIDNSLSFPHEHPKGWRSYTYGWLYLPVSIIGKEFSEQVCFTHVTKEVLADFMSRQGTIFCRC